MRCCLWILLIAVLPEGISTARAAEEPRALIERALKARGGAEAVRQRVAFHMKMRGKISSADRRNHIEGEMWELGSRGRMDLQLSDLEGARFTIVLNGEKSWRSFNGHVQDFDKEDLASLRISDYVDRVTELADLLTDKAFTFAPLADVRVDNRPAHGFKVSSKDHPDISLYFDKETDLLIKYSYRAPQFGGQQEVLHETVLSDYRVPDLASAEEKILREAKSDVTGPALLAFLRSRTPSASSLDRVRALIRKLGDDGFTVREQASHDLIAFGSLAIPLLREATRNNDREIVRRARACLQAIGEDRSRAQTAAAIRLLGLRKPAGAAEVLLNYLPSADTDLAREVQAALYAIAQAQREPDPVLMRALDDKEPLRRRVAAAALGRDGGTYARQPVRRLFDARLKIPSKHKSWTDGKLDMELEMFDYQLFNAFEDKVFAKP